MQQRRYLGISAHLPFCDSCMGNSITWLGGPSCASARPMRNALDNMHKGLSILGQTAGRYSATYLAAELAYAQVLDALGEHSQALTLRHQAESLLNNLYGNQCAGCRISVTALSRR